jgi:ketosteroid isomerase-like protein
MEIRDILCRYYDYANAGDWDRWCDLFAADMTMDEQLAGRVEGRDKLRLMMSGFGKMYTSFQNVPRQFIIEGDLGAVLSHITATSSSGKHIEADVMNFFRISGGLISYMANYHDTVPFQALAQV